MGAWGWICASTVITPDPAAFDACVMYLEDLGCVF